MSEFDDSLDESDPELSSEFAAILAEDEGDGTAPPETTAAAETPAADGTLVGDRGDGRDIKGRFAPKGGEPTADSRDAQAPKGAEGDPPPSAQPTDQPVAPVDAAAKADPAPGDAAPPADLAGFEPLTIHYDKQAHVFPGAVVTPQGIVIPLEQRELLHTVMGRGLAFEATRQQFHAERAAFEQAKHLHDAQIKPVLEQVSKAIVLAQQLRDAPDDASRAEAELALLQYWHAFATQEPVLREQIRLNRERAAFELERARMAPDPQQVEQATQQAAVAALDETLTQARSAYPAMTDADWQQVRAKVLSHPQDYFYRVGAQPSDAERAEGLQPGDFAMRLQRLGADVDERHGWRQQLLQQEANHRKAIEAAKKAAEENARRLAPSSAKPLAKPAPKPAPPKPAVEDEDEDLDEHLKREFSAMFT